LQWLQDNLEVGFLGESEVMEIALSGDLPQDLKLIVNAVTKSYMDEVVDKENKAKTEKQEKLQRLVRSYTELAKSRNEAIRRLSQQAGSDDRATLQLKKQFALEHRAALRKELAELESQKRKLQARLRLERPDSVQETSAPLVADAEVDRLVEQDPGVGALSANLADMEQKLVTESSHSRQVARNSAMDPVVKNLRDHVASIRTSLARKRGEVRRSVIRQLQDSGSGGELTKGDSNQRQLAILEEVERGLKAEIEDEDKQDLKLTDNTLDLKDEQDDLAQTVQAKNKIANELESLRVELQAESRIDKVEDAATPTTRDEKKRILMTIAIIFGSFFGTLLGIAFLELQARKVDTVDDIVVDLGLPVVGALPILPTRTRNSGTLQRTEKDRHWHNLLLESVDATRTMLVHAARSSNYRVVMVTSALPGEGKTSLSSHLATSLARSGLKTLLIDADLRCPMIHRLFELTQEPGMSELLRGESSFEDVVASTAVEELNVITSGKTDYKTMRLLAQGGMGGIFSRLKEHYDFVIVDTSPVLPVSDALLIAQQCDAVLFSILRDVSRKDKIVAAYQRLAALHVKILGAVVTGDHEGTYGKNYYPGEIYATPAKAPGSETGTGSESTS
jgi:succinoglycan biosynthesis transport protein ExoP